MYAACKKRRRTRGNESQARVRGLRGARTDEALTSSNVPDEIMELWRDYEKGESLEAKVARLSDLLATLKMALYYKEKRFDVESIEESTRREATRLLNELDLELET